MSTAPGLGADALNRHEGVCSVSGDGDAVRNFPAVGYAGNFLTGDQVEYARGGRRLERRNEIAAIRRYAQVVGRARGGHAARDLPRVQVDFRDFVTAAVCHVDQLPARVGFDPGWLAARLRMRGHPAGNG